MKKSKMKSQLVALIAFMASFSGLNAQTWNFDSNLEGWGWGLERCSLSWLSGNMVVNATTATQNSNFGYSAFELQATQQMSLNINVKNESNAAILNTWLWVKKTPGSNIENIERVTFSVTPNSSQFRAYYADLTTLPGYSTNWRFTRIRIDATQPGISGKLSFDCVHFVNGPAISFSTPGNYSSYRTGSNASYAVAVDNRIAPLVNKVEFYKDNVKIAEDLTAPYEHTISNVQSGYNKVHAVAFNSTGDTLAITKASELFVGTSKVGVRPLPRGDTYDFDRTIYPNNPGGYFADYTGQYPFVASHTDCLTHLDYGTTFEGDFRARKTYFEHYLPFDSPWIDTNPQTDPLIGRISNIEKYGVEVEHIIVSREGKLYGKPSYTWGSHPLEWRLLYQRDIDDYRQLFKDAYAAGIIKHDNYKLIQLLSEPTVFETDTTIHKIIKNMEGVCYELHQFNVHWPLETGKSKDLQLMGEAIRWTLANNLDYIMYYGPWRSTTDPEYYEDAPKDWIRRYWAAGTPKYHDKMHYYTNNFPHGTAPVAPVGPETNPVSDLGIIKWFIEEVGRQTPLAEVERIPTTRWDFDKSIERWGFGKSNCNISWIDNSLVVEPIAAGTASIGNTGFSHSLDNIDNFSVRLKNESPCNRLTVHFWISEPHQQTEQIKSFYIPITPNSSEYQTYEVDLATVIPNYTSNWRMQRIRFDAPSQTTTSRMFYDFVRLGTTTPTLYSLTVNNGSGDGIFEENSVLNINADAPTMGYAFDQWTGNVANITNVNAASTTINMPAANVNITATYKVLPFQPVTAKEWTYDVDIQGWNWGLEQCTTSWSAGNLVVNTTTATAKSNFGNSPFEVAVTDTMSLNIKVKNESNASIIYTWLWIKKTPGSNTENIELVRFNIAPNSSQFVPYSIDLTTIPGYSTNWRFTRIRMDADKPGVSGVLSFDYVRFVSYYPSVFSITVNATDTITDTAQMTATVMPVNASQSVTWSVSDNSIATIDTNGQLTVLADGQVTVTATAQDSSGVYGTRVVNTIRQPIIKQQWNFVSSTEDWDWGQANCAVSWSNGSLFIDSNGTGNTNIGCEDFNFTCNDVNYLVLNVKNQSATPYLAIWLWVQKTPGSNTETIELVKPSITPNSSNYEIVVADLNTIPGYSSNWRINRMRVDAILQTSSSNISIDYVRYQDYFSQSESARVKRPIENNEIKSEMSFKMYPNPASNMVNIETTQASRVIVCNINGQIVYSSPAQTALHNIDVRDMKKGVYIVSVYCRDKGYHNKLILD